MLTTTLAPLMNLSARRQPGSVEIAAIFGYKSSDFHMYLKENPESITEDWFRAGLASTMTNAKTKRLFDEAARRGYVRIFTDHATGAFKNL